MFFLGALYGSSRKPTRNRPNTKVTTKQTKSKQGLASLTYCGVSDECLPVGHHGVHRHLLVILTGDDRYSRLPTVLVPRPEEREAIIMTIDIAY